MTTAIMLSFVIPAIVATVLTVMLIKERDYFFNKKNVYYSHKNKPVNEKNIRKRQPEDPGNNQHYADFSGGIMGI